VAMHNLFVHQCTHIKCDMTEYITLLIIVNDFMCEGNITWSYARTTSRCNSTLPNTSFYCERREIVAPPPTTSAWAEKKL